MSALADVLDAVADLLDATGLATVPPVNLEVNPEAELADWYKFARGRLGKRGGRPFEWHAVPAGIGPAVDVDLATCTPELLRALYARARALLRVENYTSTVGEHRDVNTRRFAAGLAALLLAVQNEEMDLHGFEAQLMALWTTSKRSIIDHWAKAHKLSDHDVEARISHTEDALWTNVHTSAMRWAAAAAAPRIVRAPLFLTGWEKSVAETIGGGVWALDQAAQAQASALVGQEIGRWHAVMDQNTCIDCQRLNGQEWLIADIPQFPGDGGTRCRGNCRCRLDYTVKQAAV